MKKLITAGAFFSSLFCQSVFASECEQHFKQVSRKHGVPIGVLYAVGLTETGHQGKLQPFALNIEGKTVLAKSREEALEIFFAAQRDGKRSIDLGCMQVNHFYHGQNFASPNEMLEPRTNIVYAAKFLKQLHVEHGSWTMAVARYHAGPDNKKAQKRYICNVIKNLVLTNYGKWTAEAKSFCSLT